MVRGGGQVVSGLASYSDDPSSNPAVSLLQHYYPNYWLIHYTIQRLLMEAFIRANN